MPNRDLVKCNAFSAFRKAISIAALVSGVVCPRRPHLPLDRLASYLQRFSTSFQEGGTG
jgi:hypothetical protein